MGAAHAAAFEHTNIVERARLESAGQKAQKSADFLVFVLHIENGSLRCREYLEGSMRTHANSSHSRSGQQQLEIGKDSAAANAGPIGAEREPRLVWSSREEQRAYSVLIADDHPVVREGLRAVLDHQPDLTVVAEAANGKDAVALFVARCPDVGFIDMRMPLLDGVDTIAAICAEVPNAHLVVLTTYPSEEDVYRALHVGAQGYMLKDAPRQDLVQCVHTVVTGGTWIPPAIAAMLARRVGDRELTPRELQVLHAIAAGKSNKEIGTKLNISEGTVKVHVTHVLEKLKAGGRTEAVNLGIRRGLLREDFSIGT